jgi:hypothetical protein
MFRREALRFPRFGERIAWTQEITKIKRQEFITWTQEIVRFREENTQRKPGLVAERISKTWPVWEEREDTRTRT